MKFFYWKTILVQAASVILSLGYNRMTREALKIISSDSDAQPPLHIDPKDVYCPPTTCSTPVLSIPLPWAQQSFHQSLGGPRLGLPKLLTMISKVRVWAREIFLEHKPNHDTLLLKTSPYAPLPSGQTPPPREPHRPCRLLQLRLLFDPPSCSVLTCEPY